MTARGWYAVLAVAWAGFVGYGSLVPFDFHARPKGDALPAFRWCLENRLRPQSRSDGLANFALGVPLGFALLGACPAGWRRALALPLWAGCVGLAAGLEFAQLFVPERTCAGSDVWTQGLGAAVGMLGWVGCGDRLTRLAGKLAAHPKAGGRAGGWLAAYLLVIVGVQMLPLDLTASPADVYRKLRDGKVVLLPFAEPVDAAAGRKWLALAGLFLPAGVLAARLPRLSAAEAVAGGFVVALLTELGQLLVSRQPSATDVLVGGAGAAVGRWAGWAVLRGRA